MKRIILGGILLLMPYMLLAQGNPPLLDDFDKVINTCDVFAFNDHLNIVQAKTDNDKSTLMAINDQMKMVWKISLDGYGIKTDKFKDKIVALASSDHSRFKGTTNTFIAYIIDPDDGKILTQKEVYHSTNEYREFPDMYTGNGAFFKLVVRQSGYKPKFHIGSMYDNADTREFNQTRRLQITDYDDKLDSVSSFKAVVSNGTFISLKWNKKEDMFISWLNGPSIEIYKYDAGKTTPSNQLTVPVAFKENKNITPSDLLFMQPSEDRNVLYYSLVYLNPDKDAMLGIGKLDFQNNKKSYVEQPLDKKTLKSIQKSFTPFDKKFDDVDLGNPAGMSIKYMNETEDKVIVAVGSDALYTSGNSGYYMGYNLLFNVYNKDLGLKFQQLTPVTSKHHFGLTSDFHIDKNNLYLIVNSRKGLVSNIAVFGNLNLNTGKWEKMEYLSDKHMDSDSFSSGQSVLWFPNSYIVPFYTPKGLMQSKYKMQLQLNHY